MSTDLLRVEWPIVDPDDMPLTWLKTQAVDDLTHTLAANGLTRVGGIGWHITHGQEPTLTATCTVTARQEAVA